MTTGEETTTTTSGGGGADGSQQPPVKKKTSVKVVKRVSKKKPEVAGSRPETPQDTISEQSASPAPAPAPAAVEAPVAPKPAPVEPSRHETTTRRVSSKKRVGQRAGSNVFAMFTQNQVAQFKEAFGFIDQDKDGIISKHDIRATFDALGRLCSDKELEEMTSEAPGPINFTMFLSVFGDRVQGTDEEDVVQQAFGRFDEGDGFCKEEKLRQVLMTWGEKFSKEEWEDILQEAPVDSRGRIDVKRFATLVTRGAEEDPEQEA